MMLYQQNMYLMKQRFAGMVGTGHGSQRNGKKHNQETRCWAGGFLEGVFVMRQAGLFTTKTRASFQTQLPSVSKILFATCDFQRCLVTKYVKTKEQL